VNTGKNDEALKAKREERNEQRKQQGREGWKQEMRGKRRGTGTREE